MSNGNRGKYLSLIPKPVRTVIRTLVPAVADRGLARVEDTGLQKLVREYRLNDRHLKKLMRLAEVRGETPEITIKRLAKNAVAQIIPGTIEDRDVVLDDDFEEIGIEDDYAKIVLKNGRILYAWPSKTKYIRLYYLLCDKLPKAITPENYVAAVDAKYRYRNGGKHFLMPEEGGVAIEAGCYTGWKAIGFADRVGPTGKVIAIEIDRKNYDLMVKNIEVNNLSDVVVPVHAGVWNKKGEAVDKHRDRIYHSLVDIEEHDWESQQTVKTDRLDNIFRENGLDEIDFLNLQVNGAEIEALEGLGEYFDKVKVFRIAAYFSVGDEIKADSVVKYLQDRDVKVISRGARYGGNITAVGSRYIDEIRDLARKRTGKEPAF